MRLIDADALILAIRDYADKKCAHGEIELANGILKTLSRINNAPTIEPVKRGKWGEWNKDGYCRCSICNQKAPVILQYQDEPFTVHTDFCPHCGADMRA